MLLSLSELGFKTFIPLCFNVFVRKNGTLQVLLPNNFNLFSHSCVPVHSLYGLMDKFFKFFFFLQKPWSLQRMLTLLYSAVRFIFQILCIKLYFADPNMLNAF